MLAVFRVHNDVATPRAGSSIRSSHVDILTIFILYVEFPSPRGLSNLSLKGKACLTLTRSIITTSFPDLEAIITKSSRVTDRTSDS